MALSSEDENMLATCRRLDGLMDSSERALVDRMGAKTSMTVRESNDLRVVWEKVTVDIPRRDR